MPLLRKRKCKNCHKFFRPDPRNAGRQKYCSKAECRKASKAASQKKWLSKPENKNYFRGSHHVQRVQEWRRLHPGYWKKHDEHQKPLQDHSAPEKTEQQADARQLIDHTLQDPFSSQQVVLLGLLAHLTGSALQDDIVITYRRMRQLGQDILNHCCIGGNYDNQQATHLSPPDSPGTGPVQLDRPSPGP